MGAIVGVAGPVVMPGTGAGSVGSACAGVNLVPMAWASAGSRGLLGRPVPTGRTAVSATAVVAAVQETAYATAVAAGGVVAVAVRWGWGTAGGALRARTSTI